MKHSLYLIAFILSFSAQAQIANGDFENWYDPGFGNMQLTGWEHLGRYSRTSALFATWRDSSSQHGQYALKLSRWYYHDWDAVLQRSPVNFRPNSLSGYYRYTDNKLSGLRTLDTALLEICMTKWNSLLNSRDTIGTGNQDLALSIAYSPFTCSINYLISDIPDTISIYITPSKFKINSGVCADSNTCSFLTIDNLSMEEQPQSTGIAAVPHSNIRAYPNPVSDFLFIDTRQSGLCNMAVADVMGRIIARGTLAAGIQQLDASEWNKGMYFLMIRGPQHNEVISICKQ